MLFISKKLFNFKVYLEYKNIFRDLAARNILCSIDEDKLICKISDFGLSKIIEVYYYQLSEEENTPIPVKVYFLFFYNFNLFIKVECS